VFTLSAVVQAYSYGIVGHNKPQNRVDDEMFSAVEERKAFCERFWRATTDLFEGQWLAHADDPKKRLAYLLEMRQGAKNVLFQAIFLQALGKLCFQLGDRATWNPESPILKTLSRLDPRMVEYSAARAYTQAEDQKYEYQEWNMEWVNAMMNG
jgi:hypothetical protein